MKKFLKVLSFVVLVLGVIGTIALAIIYGVSEKETVNYLGDFNIKTVIDPVILIEILLCGLLSTVILFAILYGLYTVLERLDIVYGKPIVKNAKGQPK